MNLIDTFKQADTEVDFYSEKRKEVYATIDQLANALGYKTKKGVEKILERNSHLKEKDYSIIREVPYRLGGTLNTRLFTRLGIFEVLSLSRTEKARSIRAELFKYIERLENQLHLASVRHIKSVPTQNQLHQAIKESPVYREYEGQRLRNVFTNFNNLLNKTACLGMNKPKESMTAEELGRLEHVEHYVIFLLGEGKNYKQIQAEILPSKDQKGA